MHKIIVAFIGVGLFIFSSCKKIVGHSGLTVPV
jgi:hypothetical protein